MPGPPRVLFLASNTEDYLADSLFHGLRRLLGDQVVDAPKREIAYASFPAERRRRLYGRGFTLYGLLEEVDVDRAKVAERIEAGEFDLVVFGDIWRDFGVYVSLLPLLAHTRVAVCDGVDSPGMYPYAFRFWRVPAWWALPRANKRHPYFKREWSPWTATFRSYLTVPPPLNRALPAPRNLHRIAFAMPAEHIVERPPAKTKDFGAHVVDPEVAAAVGGRTSYAFADQAAYYADLQASRFGITTKRAGWDCLRHYEIAANGAVPCFRGLARKPATNAPHGLIDGVNCLAYRNWRDLRRTLGRLSPGDYARLQAGALDWVRANSTRERARELVEAVGLEAPI